jgi:hypothetical protein
VAGALPHPPARQGRAAPHDRARTLLDTLGVLLGGPATLVDHLEVETYTWDVLPAAHRPGGKRTIVDGIADELNWTRDQLLALGLREVTA